MLVITSTIDRDFKGEQYMYLTTQNIQQCCPIHDVDQFDLFRNNTGSLIPPLHTNKC